MELKTQEEFNDPDFKTCFFPEFPFCTLFRSLAEVLSASKYSYRPLSELIMRQTSFRALTAKVSAPTIGETGFGKERLKAAN